MIFKTFETDLEGISNKLGFSQRSFAEWGKQVSTAFEESEGFIEKFKNTLNAAFLPQNNGDLRKNAAGEIITKENIDDYLPELDNTTGSSLLKNLQENQAQVNDSSNSRTWDDFFQEWEGTNQEYLIDFVQNTNLQTASTKDLITANQNAREAIVNTNEAIQSQTLSAKAGQMALGALSSIGNSLVEWGISTAINMAASAIDNYVHRVEIANEAMDEAVSEYESAKSSLEEINSKLDEQNQQIDELLAKDSLTYVEEEQLETLQAITKELMLQKDIEEKQTENASKEAAEKTLDAYEKQYEIYDTSEDGLKQRLAYTDQVIPANEDDVAGNIAAYINAIGLQKQAQKELNDALNYKGDATGLADKYQDTIDAVDIYSQALDNNLSDLKEKKDALYDEYNKAIEKKDSGLEPLTSTEKEVIEKYESIYDLMKMIYEYTDPNAWNNMEIESIFNTQGIEKSKEELIQMAKSGELTAETLKQLPELNKAIQESQIFSENDDVADIFLNSIKAAAEESDEPVPLSFQDAWASLDTTEEDNLIGLKEKLLSLAEAGQLTLESFQAAEGSTSLLSMLGIEEGDTDKINDLISQINSLTSSSEQFVSTKDGISELSMNLSAREQEPGVAIESDVLDGMDAGLKAHTKEWERYEAVLGNASSSMEEVREATNKLATAYVSSNDFLANLTEANKDYYISQLDSMGVANSAEIVENGLNAQREVAEYKTQALSIAMKDLADSQAYYSDSSANSVNAAYEHSAAFANQSGMTDLAKASLADLIAKENIFAATGLNTSSRIKELNKLALAYFGVSNAIQISTAMGADHRYWNSPEEYEKAVQDAWDSFYKKQMQKYFSPSTNPPSSKPPTNNTSSPENPDQKKPEKEFSELFNWIERQVKRFQSAFDKWLKRAETALTSGFVNKYYNKAISAAKSQLSTYSKAYNRYMAEANAVGLDETYASKVRNGTLDIETIYAKGSEKDIKEYEENAEKIKSYQDWLDKANESMDSFIETAEKLYNLPLDKAAKKIKIFNDSIDLLDKKLANAIGSINKNNIIDEQTKEKKRALKASREAQAVSKKSLNAAAKNLQKPGNLNKDDGISKKERTKIKTAIKNNKEVDLSFFKKDSKGYKAAEKYNKELNAYKKNYKNTPTTQKALRAAKKELKKNNNLDADDGITAKEKKKIQDAVKNNKQVDLSFFNENSEGYKAAVKYNEALKANKKAADDVAAAQEEYNRYLVESSKQKFDNVADDYNKKLQKLDWKKSKYDNDIAEIEASGKKVGISYYNTQKNINDQTLKQLMDEKDALEDNLKSIKKGTDEWYEAKDEIQQIDSKISDCVQTTYELNNAINQLHFDYFNDVSEVIGRIVTEQEFLRGLFAHEKNVDPKTGDFTDAGLANLGSLSASYYATEYDIDRYRSEIKELQRMADSGELVSKKLGLEFNSKEDLLKYLNETYTKEQDLIKQSYSLKTEIYNLEKERYQAELDYLKELIDAKKESLQAEKDLHDYNKTINEKTDSISTIKKQIAAYSGDTSQEGMAKLQKLQKELADKEEDLRETEYNRLISDQQDMLDKLYEEYEDILSKKMEDFMDLVEEGLKTANGKMAIIASYIQNVAKDNGYDIQTDGLFDNSSGKDIEGNSGKAAKNVEKGKKDLSGTKENKKMENAIMLSNVKAYIKEYASDAKKEKGKYNAVNQKIFADEENAYTGTGKILSTKELKGLAKLLGVKYDGKDDSELYKKLEEIGYFKDDKKTDSDKKKNTSKKEKKTTSTATLGKDKLSAKKATQKTSKKKKATNSVKKKSSISKTTEQYEKALSSVKKAKELSGTTRSSQIEEHWLETLQVFSKALPEGKLQATSMDNLWNAHFPNNRLNLTQGAGNMNNIVNIDTLSLPSVTNYDEFRNRMFQDMQNSQKYANFLKDVTINRIDGFGKLAKNRQTL